MSMPVKRKRKRVNSPHGIVTFPAFKLERKLNEPDRDGWELRKENE